MRKIAVAAITVSALALAAGPALAIGAVGGLSPDTSGRQDILQASHMQVQQDSGPRSILPRRTPEHSQFWPLLGNRERSIDPFHRRFGPQFQSHHFPPSAFGKPDDFRFRHPHTPWMGSPWWKSERW